MKIKDLQLHRTLPAPTVDSRAKEQVYLTGQFIKSLGHAKSDATDQAAVLFDVKLEVLIA